MIGLIIVALLLVLLCGGVWVVEASAWFAIVPTVLVLAALVAHALYKRRRERAAARQLEAKLEAQADEQERGVRPDLQPEIKAMRAEFAKAVAALKASKLGRRGADALSVLPWYLIVGPPGAGKSTALRNSGLKFPYLSARGGVRGVGGTRNCEWWLTNEAVVLDSAGRYATEDDDREEWLAFLDTLARARPHRPINGLIVAVSVSDLLETDEQGAEELGQRLRERVDETMSRLGVVAPVYLLVTKCDLLTGFVEMFEELPRSTRGQVWGFTARMDEAEPPPELFRKRFDELVSVLSERVPGRLREARERPLEQRERIHQLPVQLLGLRGKLRELVQPLFSEDAFRDTPRLRGVYFTSGTQQAIKVAIGGTGLGKLLNPHREGAQPATEERSYFLRDLFSQIIFRDQRLAVRTAMQQRRQRLVRYGTAAGGVLLAALLVLIPWMSFLENRALTRSVFDAVEHLPTGNETGQAALGRLEPLRKSVEELRQYKAEDSLLQARFWLSQVDGLLEPAETRFQSEMTRLVVLPQVKEDELELRRFNDKVARATEPLPQPELDRAYATFGRYMRETRPGAPNPDKAQLATQAAQLVEGWREREELLPDNEADSLLAQVRPLVGLYVKLVADHPEFVPDRDPALVLRTQKSLVGYDRKSQLLGQLLAYLQEKFQAVTLKGVVGNASGVFQNDPVLSGACTEPAFASAREWISESQLDADAWFMDQPADAAVTKDKLRQDLRDAYDAHCEQELNRFLAALVYKHLESEEDARELVATLVSSKSPLLTTLFLGLKPHLQMHANTGAVRKDFAEGLKERTRNMAREFRCGQAALDKAANCSTAERAANPFAGLIALVTSPQAGGDGASPKSSLLEEYQQLLAPLKGMLAAGSVRPADFRATMKDAKREVESLIQGKDPRWQDTLRNLMLRPLEEVDRAILGAGQKDFRVTLDARLGEGGRATFQSFPFVMTERDASVENVAAALLPNGIIWSYCKEVLNGEAGGYSTCAKELRKQGLASEETLRLLTALQVLTPALSSPGSSELQFEFSALLDPVPDADGVTDVVLTIHGERVPYGTGPDSWKAIRWNGKGPPGASLVVKMRNRPDYKIDVGGDWAIVRLLKKGTLEKAEGKRAVPGMFRVAFRVPGTNAVVNLYLKPKREENPFFGISVPRIPSSVFQPFTKAGAAFRSTLPVGRRAGSTR